MDYFKVATIQYNPVLAHKETNINNIENLIEEAIQQAANVIVLPEMCTTGYVFEQAEDVHKLAEDKEGESFLRLSSVAKRHQIYIVYGYVQKDDGRYFNSQNLIDDRGNLMTYYQKMNLFEMDESWACAGETGYVSIQSPFAKIGLGICMDLHAKSFYNFHYQQQTELYLISNHWLASNRDTVDYWHDQFSSVDGIVSIANAHSKQGAYEFGGQSCCIEDGQLIASCGIKKNQVLVTSHKI